MPYKLSAVKRKEKGEEIRTKIVIPAVVYGAGSKNFSLSLNYNEFIKLYNEAGESSLIDLVIDDKDVGKVLIHEVQHNPVSDRIIHVDLRRIDMNKPVEATVELSFVGESPVVKELGGMVVYVVEEVDVRCLPNDLVSKINIDLSVLKTFTDVIKVKNIQLPNGVEIIFPSAEDVIAKAQAALTEEEITAMEAGAKTDLSQIEVAGKKKEEDGVAEAGDTAQGKDGVAKPEAKKEEKKEKK
jgi:large subunit ribosomal protein L25